MSFYSGWEKCNRTPRQLRDRGRLVLKEIEDCTPLRPFLLLCQLSNVGLAEPVLRDMSDQCAADGCGVDPWDKRRLQMQEQSK